MQCHSILQHPDRVTLFSFSLQLFHMMWLASCLRLTTSQCHYLTGFNEIQIGDGIEICRIPISPKSARLIL